MSKTSSPNGVLKRINDLTHMWETLRPNKSFSGLTLEQFKAAVKPSLDVRAEMTDLKGRTQAVKQRRTAVDKTSSDVIRGVVNAIKSDREDGGEDSELYASLGYVSRSMRNSGLTRRRVNGETKPQDAS